MMKILILEDNKELQEALKELLTEQNHEVTQAFSFKEAVHCVQQENFDIYMIDVLLPDNKGYELFKKINPSQNAKFILMSGLFNKSSILKHIPSSLVESHVFLKKPLETEELLNCIEDFKKTCPKKEAKHFFYEATLSKELKDYFPENKTFDGQELISLVYLAHISLFTGVINVNLNNKKSSSIEFYQGFITKVIHPDENSFFGQLLVEHGLSLKEDVEKILEDKGSNQYLGERLVENKLLSPHMLNILLKEQVKIRLTQMMSSLSFSVQIKPQEETTNTSSLSFNKEDLIDWVIDSIQTNLKNSFLESFHTKYKNDLIQTHHAIQLIPFKHQKFIKKYNECFKQMKDNTSLEDFIKTKESFKHNLQIIYFGILTKSLFFVSKEETENQIQKIQDAIEDILKKNPNDLFQILNLPWNPSEKEIHKKYKELVKLIHPDKITCEASKELKEKAKEAFQKVKDSYEILSDSNERELYLKRQEGESALNVLSVYEEGVSLIKNKKFKESMSLLEQIEDDDRAPRNTRLYVIWAQIKLNPSLHTNKNLAGQIKKEIELCPLDERVSALFWFVSGLYYQATKSYDKALPLFQKTLQIKKDFKEARQEMAITNTKLKEVLNPKQKSSLLKSFLKKSS